MKVIIKRTFDKKIKFTYCDNALYVDANWKLSVPKIKQLINENWSWILSQKGCANQHVSTRNISNGLDSESSLINGSAKTSKENTSSISLDSIAFRKLYNYETTLINGEFFDIVSCDKTYSYTDQSNLFIPSKNMLSKDLCRKAVNTYLKKMSNAYVSSEISTIGTRLSLCPQKIQFLSGNQWTDCKLSAQRCFALHYKTIQLPADLRALIIYHTFAHFYYPSHDDRYFQVLSSMLPNYSFLKDKLLSYDFLLDLC